MSTRWRVAGSRSSEGFLTPAGVQRAALWAALTLKTMNVIQAVVAIGFAWDSVARRWLELVLLGLVIGGGLLIAGTGLPRGELVGWAVMVDVGVAVAVLFATPLFQPTGGAAWTDWPIQVTFLAGCEAAACFRWPLVAVITAGLMGASGSWLPRAPGVTDDSVVRNLPAYVGFSLVTYVFLLYLRRLADLADGRARRIQALEDERMRRVLHTPYRLLNDLADMLRKEAGREAGVGEDPRRRARLAEAVASVQEIESIVRGTEPAGSDLAAELTRLADQFIDLPLTVNIASATRDLSPAVVYPIREATRSALQNVRLHADARVVVLYAETSDDGWLVSVHDDGRGVDRSRKLGVGTVDLMQKALGAVGGRVQILSEPGEGTLVEFQGGAGWTSARESSA